MGFLDKAKAAAEQMADKANDTVSDVQTKRDLQKTYGELGEKAFKLADSGSISHPALATDVARIRELQAKLADEADAGSAQAEAPEAVEQPLSGAEAPTP